MVAPDEIQKIHDFSARFFIDLQLLVAVVQGIQKYGIVFIEKLRNFYVLITEQLVLLREDLELIVLL